MGRKVRAGGLQTLLGVASHAGDYQHSGIPACACRMIVAQFSHTTAIGSSETFVVLLFAETIFADAVNITPKCV